MTTMLLPVLTSYPRKTVFHLLGPHITLLGVENENKILQKIHCFGLPFLFIKCTSYSVKVERHNSICLLESLGFSLPLM